MTVTWAEPRKESVPYGNNQAQQQRQPYSPQQQDEIKSVYVSKLPEGASQENLKVRPGNEGLGHLAGSQSMAAGSSRGRVGCLGQLDRVRAVRAPRHLLSWREAFLCLGHCLSPFLSKMGYGRG